MRTNFTEENVTQEENNEATSELIATKELTKVIEKKSNTIYRNSTTAEFFVAVYNHLIEYYNENPPKESIILLENIIRAIQRDNGTI